MNDSNNKNNLNNDIDEFDLEKISSEIEAEIKIIIPKLSQTYPYLRPKEDSTFPNSIEELKQLVEITTKLQKKYKKWRKENAVISTDFLKLFYYYRLKFAESFIKNMERLIEELRQYTESAHKQINNNQQDYKNLLSRKIYLGNTFPTVISMLSDCELAIDQEQEIVGENFALKLAILSSEIRKPLTAHYIFQLPTFLHRDAVTEKIQHKYTVIKAVKPKIGLLKDDIVVKFIAELRTILEKNERRQIILYPTAIPDDVIIIDASMIDGKLTLAIIGFNNLSSYYSFVEKLTGQLKKLHSNFCIALAQIEVKAASHSLFPVPEKCLEICAAIENIHLPQLVLALNQKQDTKKFSKNLLTHLPDKFNVAFTKESYPIHSEAAWQPCLQYPCLNMNYLLDPQNAAELKPLLIPHQHTIDELIAILEKESKDFLEKNKDKELYKMVWFLLEELREKRVNTKEEFELQKHTYNIFSAIIKNLSIQNNEALSFYFYSTCRLIYSFYCCFDAIVKQREKNKKFCASNEIQPLNELKDTAYKSIEMHKQFKLLVAESNNLIKSIRVCEDRRKQADKVINPTLLQLFDRLMLSAEQYLNKIYSIDSEERFLSYSDIAKKIQNEKLSGITCFKSSKNKFLASSNDEAVLDFYNNQLNAFLVSKSDTHRYIIFPCLDPQSCFLLELSYSQIEQKFFFLIVSALNHPAQIDFLNKLIKIIDAEYIPYQIFHYQQQLKSNLFLIPQLHLELCSLLDKIRTACLFELYSNNLLKEKTLFIDHRQTPIIPGSILLNSNLFFSSTLPTHFDWNFLAHLPDNLRVALTSFISMKAIINILLFAKGFTVTEPEQYRKLVKIAKQYDCFNLVFTDTPPYLSPLQIALELGYYAHANALIEEGADVEYINRNNDSVREYFYQTLSQAKLIYLKRNFPTLCTVFHQEIQRFEANLHESLSSNSNNNDNSDIDDDISLDSIESDDNVNLEEDLKAVAKKVTEIAASSDIYQEIQNILFKINKNDSYFGIPILDLLNQGCANMKKLITGSNQSKKTNIVDQTTSENLLIYFYFITCYSTSTFDYIALINMRRNVNDEHLPAILEHCHHAINYLVSYEKFRTAISNGELKYEIVPSVEALLDEQIDNLFEIASKIFKLVLPTFISYPEIERIIANEQLAGIQCYKNNRTKQVCFISKKFTQDLLQEVIKPIVAQETSKQIIVFPLQQPHLCFLLHISFTAEKLYIVYIAVNELALQDVFLNELHTLLNGEKFNFEIFHCQRRFKETSLEFPRYIFNVAKTLNTIEFSVLFELLSTNSLSENIKKLIVGEQYAVTVRKAINNRISKEPLMISAINPDLFLPEHISLTNVTETKNENQIVKNFNPLDYLKKVLLFKPDYFVDIQAFKQIILTAKKYNVFETLFTGNLKRSPVQIAFEKKLFDYALVLLEAGADPHYQDTQGKSVKQYYESAKKENQKAKSNRKQIPSKLETFFQKLSTTFVTNDSKNHEKSLGIHAAPIEDKNLPDRIKKKVQKLDQLTRDSYKNNSVAKRINLIQLYLEIIKDLKSDFLIEIKKQQAETTPIYITTFYRFASNLAHELVLLPYNQKKSKQHYQFLIQTLENIAECEYYWDKVKNLVSSETLEKLATHKKELSVALNNFYQHETEEYWPYETIQKNIKQKNIVLGKINDQSDFIFTNPESIHIFVQERLTEFYQNGETRKQFILSFSLLSTEYAVIDVFMQNKTLFFNVIGFINSYAFFNLLHHIYISLQQTKQPFRLFVANENLNNHFESIPKMALSLAARLNKEINLSFLFENLEQNLIPQGTKLIITDKKYFNPMFVFYPEGKQQNILDETHFQFLIQLDYFNFALFAQNKNTNSNIGRIQHHLINKIYFENKFEKLSPEVKAILSNFSQHFSSVIKLIDVLNQNGHAGYSNYRNLLKFLSTSENNEVPAEKIHHLLGYFTYEFTKQLLEDIQNSKEVTNEDTDVAIQTILSLQSFAEQTFFTQITDLIENSQNKTHEFFEKYKTEKLIIEVSQQDYQNRGAIAPYLKLTFSQQLQQKNIQAQQASSTEETQTAKLQVTKSAL